MLLMSWELKWIALQRKQIKYYEQGIYDESVKNRQKNVLFSPNKSFHLVFRLKNLFSMKPRGENLLME